MKTLHSAAQAAAYLFAALCILFCASSAQAQWQTPQYSVPIGRGAGTGFDYSAPGAAGGVLTSKGESAKPEFVPLFFVTPEDFGAANTENSSTDDKPYIDAAVAALTSAGGGTLMLRRCYYLNSGAITVTDTSINIAGNGELTSCLKVKNSTGGIRFNSTSSPSYGYHVLGLDGFSVVAMDNGATPTDRGYCIWATWALAPDQLKKLTVNNVTCKSETYDATRGYFSNGLRISQADGAAITNFNFYQINSTTGSGIWIDNSNTPSSYEYTITNASVNGGQYGIRVSGCMEGLHVNGPLLVLNDYGIYGDASSCTNSPAIGHNIEAEIIGGSFNSNVSAIKLVDWFDVHISGASLGSTTGPVIDLTRIGNLSVIGNIPMFTQTGSYAITVTDVANCSITGNNITAQTGTTAVMRVTSTVAGTYVPGCTITGNAVTAGDLAGNGIDITNMYDGVVSSNTIRTLGGIGIVANASSSNNRVEGNTIKAATPYSLAGGTYLVSQDVAAGPSSFLNSGTYVFAGGVNGFAWNDQTNLTTLASLSNAGHLFARNQLISGVAGAVSGGLVLYGSTSGGVTIVPQAAAGTYNFNLPTSAGSSGQALLSGGGGVAAMTFGTLGVGAGGTGLTSGTSGGVPYFNSTSTMASSALLTANAIVLGGGAGAAPAPLGSLGTTTTVLHGNAGGAPTWGAVSLSSDVSGDLPFSNLTQGAANTVLANATSGTADFAAFSMPSCSTSGSALKWTTNTGFGCNTSIDAATLLSGTWAIPGTIGSTTPNTGAFTTVTMSTAATIGSNGVLTVNAAVNNTASRVAGVTIAPALTGSAGAGIALGLDVNPYFAPSASIGTALGSYYTVTYQPDAGVTITTAAALSLYNYFPGSAGAVTSAYGVIIDAPIIGGALKPVTNYGAYIANQGASGITTSHGLYMAAQSGSTTNYALWYNSASPTVLFASGGLGVGTSTDPGGGSIATTAFASIGTKIRAGGSAPTVGTCGTSPSISGSDLAGTVTTGSTATTSCTVTFNAAYASAPYCTATPDGAANSGLYVTASTTTLVLTYTSATSAKFHYHCIARSAGWLLNRDLDQSNDNDPLFLEKAA